MPRILCDRHNVNGAHGCACMYCFGEVKQELRRVINLLDEKRSSNDLLKEKVAKLELQLEMNHDHIN